MDKVTFKSTPIMMDWQWVVLIGFCILLISALFIAKRYGKQINKQNTSKKFMVELQRISRTAVIYNIEQNNQKFVIFESEYGVVQLQNTPALHLGVELDDKKREK